MSFAYRSSYQHLVGARVAEIKRASEQLEPLLPRLASLRTARRARIAAGVVGVAGALAMGVVSLTDDPGAPTYALVGGGVAAVGSYVLVRGLGAIRRAFGRAGIGPLPALTGHLDADLARLDADSPVREIGALTDRVDRLESYSTGLPLVAISLLAPLTLHLLVSTLFDRSGPFSPSGLRDFSQWIRISLLIVGHAHIALVACAALFARKMRRLDDEGLGKLRIAPEWAKALGMAVLVAAVPGVLLLAVPPLLAAVTGIAFIPLMYIFMHRRLTNERAVLQLARDAMQVRVADPSEASAALEELTWNEHVAAAQLTASS